jgi:hypothetical protein
MTQLNVFTALVGLALLAVFFEMLRRRQLREKYAVLWIVVGLGAVLPLAIFPEMLNLVARNVGVENGASLVLFLGFVLLLLICTHLSWEVSQLEEETRVLAEEVALIRTQLEQRSIIPERTPPATPLGADDPIMPATPAGPIREEAGNDH